MARPEPTTIFKDTDRKTGKTLEVLAAETVYFVTYNNLPVGMRTGNDFAPLAKKYTKTTFVNPGHAHNLAERLNKTFKSKLFEVHSVTKSQVEVEHE